ncbi:MAG: tetratricopeptide repeat protein, partial [Lachnospiraceae bacterium]|nr:tetratricopeptide repeat protein [Lachnospiraceae bacterium]
YHKVKQNDDARTVIERYRVILPESESMSYYEGLTLRLEEKYQDAINVLQSLRERHNKKSSDLEDYDEVLLLLGDCYDKINDDAEAVGCYQDVIAHTPEHKSAHGDLAYMYKKLGRYQESLEEFTRQIEIARHPLYYINRGILNKFFGNYKSALEDFQHAVNMDPQNAYCYSRIGIIYQMHREFDKAMNSFDMALKLVGEDKALRAEVLRWKAKNYACTGDYSNACGILKELMDEGYAEDQYICYDMAGYLLRANRFTESKALLQDYIHDCKDKRVKLTYLKLLLQQLGEEGYLGEAVETYKLIVSMEPNDFRTYGYMGRIFAQLGRYNEAKEMFTKAVAIDKRREENYYSELIEVIYKKAGLIKPNCDDLIMKANIASEDMKTPREYIKMARLYRVTKKYDLAMKYIDNAIAMRRCDTCSYSGCEEAYYEKALIYEAMKQWDMARACLLKALQIHGHCEVYSRRLNELSKKLK